MDSDARALPAVADFPVDFHTSTTDQRRRLLVWYRCGRKQRFDTFTEAEHHCIEVETTYPPRPDGLRPYVVSFQCSDCQGWHVGKPSLPPVFGYIPAKINRYRWTCMRNTLRTEHSHHQPA